MIFLTGSELNGLLTYDELISALQRAFAGNEITTPARHHHTIAQDGSDATLLLMPAWQERYLGVKVVSVFPENNQAGSLDTIQGTYLLMDGNTGEPLVGMDAKVLTNLRTAATSALAGKLLQEIDNGVMLMIGTGSLAPYLIAAHHSVHQFSEILISGRSLEKSMKIRGLVQQHCKNTTVRCVAEREGRREADLISVATLAREPILHGAELSETKHIDLVGAYTPEMREVDDDLISRGSIYVDTLKALEETGDLAIPLGSGVISNYDIQGTLQDICAPEFQRPTDAATTVFKSVGHASEDLVAAVLAYEKWKGAEEKFA